MTGYTRKAFFGFLFVGVGAVFANMFGYLLRLLLARSLTVEEYGLIYSVMALFGLLSAFYSLGLTEAIAKYTSEFGVKRDDARIKEIVLWSARALYPVAFVIAGVGFFSADWLGVVYFKSDIAPTLVRLFAISLVFVPIDVLILGLLQGRQRLAHHALYTATRSFVLLFATWIFLMQGFGPSGAMLAYVVAYAVSYCVFLPWLLPLSIPRFFSLRVKMRRSTLDMLLRYGTPVMLTSMASIVLFYTDTMLLTIFSSLHEVGVYQAALPTANILLFFATMLTVVMLPLIAELWARRRTGLIRLAVEELYLAVFIVMLPLSIAAVIYPDLILNLLFGASFIEGADILRALAIAVLFMALHAVNAATLSGVGRPGQNTKAVAIGAACNLVANLILIPRMGGLGAAIGTLISAIIMFSISTAFVHRILRMSIPYVAWCKALIASVLFSGTIWVSRSMFNIQGQYLKVVVGVLLGAAVYICVLLLLRAITFDELRSMYRRVFSHR
ncbi:TPA: flippase [Candidatus Woesearchaeota archaeon]|nr:flippase [Candidatus Woesearchaeota archaeon]